MLQSHSLKTYPILSGAGGNIEILTGTEGKFVVDTGVLPAAPGVLQALGQIDALPLKYLVNTHWHFDHTDGNAQFHGAGATIVASEKTRERLSTPQTIEVFQLHFPASPSCRLAVSHAYQRLDLLPRRRRSHPAGSSTCAYRY